MAHPSPFADYLAARLPLVERALTDAAAAPLTNGAASDDLRDYLYDPLARFTASGGKRVRPALCLLGAEAVGGRAEDALSCAVAVELFQSAALIHDDIADEGELRRGEPCLHRVGGARGWRSTRATSRSPRSLRRCSATRAWMRL